jgi:hypothetical protein
MASVCPDDPVIKNWSEPRCQGMLSTCPEDVILSPRPADWGPYLDTGPVASDVFMQNVGDLPVQEREP